jgi:hypothetical protein
LHRLFTHRSPLAAIACYHPDVPARGKFITFEGLDGSGKSTQTRETGAVPARPRPLRHRHPRTGRHRAGEKIREVLLHSATSGLSPLTEMALMFASRAQHIHEVILPALAEGRIVLCDRFTDSTEAYQGGGRKLGIEARAQPARNPLRQPATRPDHPAGQRGGFQRRARAASQSKTQRCAVGKGLGKRREPF